MCSFERWLFVVAIGAWFISCCVVCVVCRLSLVELVVGCWSLSVVGRCLFVERCALRVSPSLLVVCLC